jgi:hypothetical protein
MTHGHMCSAYNNEEEASTSHDWGNVSEMGTSATGEVPANAMMGLLLLPLTADWPPSVAIVAGRLLVSFSSRTQWRT